MMKKRLFSGLLFYIFSNFQLFAFDYDVTIVDHSKRGASLAEHGMSFLRCLKNDVKIKFIPYEEGINLDLPSQEMSLIKHSTKFGKNDDIGGFSPVLILTNRNGLPFMNRDKNKNNAMRLMYDVAGRTECNSRLVAIYNDRFDALLVPDEFVAESFIRSGITIPVFVLPLALNLENYFDHEPCMSEQFVFGSTGLFGATDRKNFGKLVDAFIAEFKGNNKVKLVVHGRSGDQATIAKLKRKVKQSGATNIVIFKEMLIRKNFENLIKSFNCFVLASKGEGFSIIPREAMACGIPCILSNNTAHKIICRSGFVCPVPADIPLLEKNSNGINFDCTVEDLQKALHAVYSNYQHFIELAAQGREWVKQYSPENLRNKYLNVIKPKKIILGENNIITDEYLMTNSKKLYEQYSKNLTI